MRWILVGAALVLILSAGPARAQAASQDKGPYQVFAAIVHLGLDGGQASGDYHTLVRVEPRSGKTWVMVPALGPTASPYWIPVDDPTTTKSKL